jgi:hypothetical protein
MYRRRFDALLEQEKKRIIHDETIPYEQLEERFLDAAEAVKRKVTEEGRRAVAHLTDELKRKIDLL